MSAKIPVSEDISRSIKGIFDTHCHYDESVFDSDRRDLLDEMFESGTVSGLMHASCDLISSQAGIKLAEEYENYYCAIGIHPTYIHFREELPSDYIDRLKMLASHPKVRAIGEAGLDYHDKSADREEQKCVFIEQIKLSQELDLPLIIHCRSAYGDLVDILKKHPARCICHCFGGSAETAAELVKMGHYIAFGGALTWKNAENPRRALKAVPTDRLLFETDAPFLAPEVFRGYRCDSRMTVYAIETAAEILGIPAQELADITRENAKRIFDI